MVLEQFAGMVFGHSRIDKTWQVVMIESASVQVYFGRYPLILEVELIS